MEVRVPDDSHDWVDEMRLPRDDNRPFLHAINFLLHEVGCIKKGLVVGPGPRRRDRVEGYSPLAAEPTQNVSKDAGVIRIMLHGLVKPSMGMIMLSADGAGWKVDCPPFSQGKGGDGGLKIDGPRVDDRRAWRIN